MALIKKQAINIQSDLISVIMPCYNGEKYLPEAIDSVLKQRHGNIELIVVDDGSTDASRDIVHTYGHKVRLIEQQNSGPYPARNRGMREASGHYLAFLDADDYWSPEFLDATYKALQGNNAALAYCGWQNVGLPDKESRPYIPPDYEAGNKLSFFLSAAAPWPIHAALVRRNAMEEAGGFDEQFATCMDYDLWLRIGARHPIVRVEEVMAFYRHHREGQITSTQWRQARNVWLVKKKFVESAPELVKNFSAEELREFIDGGLLQRGFDAYWKRDLVSARKIFRLALRTGVWRIKDLKYLLPALLPDALFRAIIGRADNR